MDDKNQIQGQVPNQPPQQGGAGSLVKEHGPIATGDVQPSGIEPEIHRELEQIGVKSVPEFPEVKPEHQRIGISPAKESVPVQTVPSGHVQIPMTEEEARQTLKEEKPENALKWLAALIVKHFKQAHHKLLTSNG